MEKYENIDVCAKCKGICCRTMGCHLSPTDFREINYGVLKEEIQKGKLSIDWWEGDATEKSERGKSFFLRMRHKGASVVDPAFGGECILLTSEGCPLTYEERPMGGRLLVPNKDGHKNGCFAKYTKQECAIEWIKHEEILKKLYEEFIGQDETNAELEKMIKRMFDAL